MRCRNINQKEKFVKKPTLKIEEPVLKIEEQPAIKSSRADIRPTEGFVLTVDGHFKTWFATSEAAEEAAQKLKSRFQMLKVQVYDASARTWSVPL